MSNTVVQTNVMSINSHRNLGLVGNAQARASARLSSGFRINSAADDAAGLAISEKMRAQIRGLDQASRNGQDGISLIQTAEGAMNIVNDMVIRIRELVVQASNDTNAHDGSNLAQSDRIQIQREINALMNEVDDITLRTEFNTRTLLDGSLAADPLRGVSIDTISTFMNTGVVGGENIGVEHALQALVARELELDIAKTVLEQYNTNRDLLVNIHQQTSAITALTIAQEVRDFVALLDGGLDPGLTAADMATSIATGLGLASSALGAGSAAQEAAVVAIRAELDGGPAWAGLAAGGAAAAVTARRDMITHNLIGNMIGFATGVPALPADLEETEAVVAAAATNTSAQILAAGNIELDPHGIAVRAGAFAALAALVTGTGAYSLTSAAEAAESLENREINARAARDFADGLVAGHSVIGQQFSTIADLQNAIALHEAGESGNALWFHIGANSNQGIRLNIEAVNVKRLDAVGAGLTELTVSKDTLDNVAAGFSFAALRNDTLSDLAGIMRFEGEQINRFVDAIDAALAHVAGQRANLGATQNRLEFTIENLDIASENLNAANSRIRDADMAQEMMRFTQSNVLQQAAISMLAQANQAPQSILSLLR